jgi:rRNA processing protein Gar1
MLIVKVKGSALPGQVLVDEKGRLVGRITEVFGPVKAPYASVRTGNVATSLLGKKVFAKGERRN